MIPNKKKKSLFDKYFALILFLFVGIGFFTSMNLSLNDLPEWIEVLLIESAVGLGIGVFLYPYLRKRHIKYQIPKNEKKALNKFKELENLGFTRTNSEYIGIYRGYKVIISYFEREEEIATELVFVDYISIKVPIQKNEFSPQEIVNLMKIFDLKFEHYDDYCFLLDELSPSSRIGFFIDQLNTIIYQLKKRKLFPKQNISIS